MRGEYSVTINRSAHVVFGHICDGTRNATWRPAVIQTALQEGDGGAGSVWHQLVRGPGGKTADADYRVTRSEPPTSYEVEVIAGPIRGHTVYSLSEDEHGATTLHAAVTLTPRGAMRILTGFVLRQLVEELNGLDRLRDLLNAARRYG